jgi:purine-binding chemotaxis protein CheW
MIREQAIDPRARAGALKPEDHRCFTVVTEGRAFGLPVESIQTVFEMVTLTPVPLAPFEILGLVNLRGKIVTAISLKRRLRGDRKVADTSILAIGMEHRGESFALVVDEVGDVIMLEPGTKIPIPPHLGAEGIKISAVHRLESIILPILDLDWVFTFSRDA